MGNKGKILLADDDEAVLECQRFTQNPVPLPSFLLR